MRVFQILFMFLIGMIGFTSTASTPLMEANQKTSFEKPETVFSIVKNVQTLEITVINFERSTLFYFREHCKNFNFTEPASYAGLNDESQKTTFTKEPPIHKIRTFPQLLEAKFTIRNNC
jgi:hypothetical protein